MTTLSFKQRAGKWLTVAAIVGCSFAAIAQSEPTLNQIYEAAQSGKMDQAQTMMQQVLVAHPSSAKAHFVQAELAARQGDMSRARESLATAEKLAPGLPFAKADSVQHLRTQLAGNNSAPVASNRAVQTHNTAMAAPAAPASSFPLGLGLALGGGAIALVIFLMRKKQTPEAMQQPTYANATPGSGLSGPQGFGMPNNGYGQPAYGQPGYGQPAGSGLGGKVMGGLATGLAVGAGVMAAQAIGRSMMGNDEHPAHSADNGNNNGYQPIASNSNSDLGGQNFGVNDAGSWDDGSSSMASSGDGGGDWDS